MKITILTYGTRGDVQPFLALAIGLRNAGHAVRLAAPGVFADFVTGRGIDFAPLPGDPAELSRLLVDEARLSPVRTVQAISRFAMPLGIGVMRASRDACTGADAVIHSFLLTLAGHAAARERGIPDFSAQTFPSFCPTGYFPAPWAPDLPLGGLYNRFTHAVMDVTFFRVSQAAYIGLRRANPDLPRRVEWPFGGSKDRPPTPILSAISPHVLPPPPDWPERNQMTGYWFLDEEAGWRPPEALVRFLESGPPPVYIGFGSVVTGRGEQLGRIAREALERAGLRGVLLGGWSGIGQGEADSPDILRIDSAPHSWLFPRMAAIVHHGGAGTTAAALRSGVPGILTPFSSDQPFWAGRVEKLNVSPAPIPIRRLTAENLAGALHIAVTDEAMRTRAAALGAQIRAEDGVTRAVALIEQWMQKEA